MGMTTAAPLFPFEHDWRFRLPALRARPSRTMDRVKRLCPIRHSLVTSSLEVPWDNFGFD
jgi:hypothetical protein